MLIPALLLLHALQSTGECNIGSTAVVDGISAIRVHEGSGTEVLGQPGAPANSCFVYRELASGVDKVRLEISADRKIERVQLRTPLPGAEYGSNADGKRWTVTLPITQARTVWFPLEIVFSPGERAALEITSLWNRRISRT